MTKKDFILIAQILKAARNDADQTQVHDKLAVHFAYVLEQQNPLFDRNRFMGACR